MMNVQNELGVIVVFAQTCQQYGWKINHIQIEFPDAIIQDKNGDTYRAEFEFCSSNFKAHGHDLFGCDVIICWENDWNDCPLTIWSMKDWNTQTVKIADRRDITIATLLIENERLKRKVACLDNAVKLSESVNEQRRCRIDTWREICADPNDYEAVLIDELRKDGASNKAAIVNEILSKRGLEPVPDSTARYWADDVKDDATGTDGRYRGD